MRLTGDIATTTERPPDAGSYYCAAEVGRTPFLGRHRVRKTGSRGRKETACLDFRTQQRKHLLVQGIELAGTVEDELAEARVGLEEDCGLGGVGDGARGRERD
jgi:hypothetical protein